MYFSERFEISAIAMDRLGVFNPDIEVDNHMFIDPKMLEEGQDEFSGARDDLIAYFAGTVQLVQTIKKRSESDLAWSSAWRRMRFKETTNTALGFSKDGTDGNGIGPTLAKRIIDRAAEILPQVDYAPDVFELIGVFAEGIGCDRLSDMIVAILKRRFLEYTHRITHELGIKFVNDYTFNGVKYKLPKYKTSTRPSILVPQLLLKPLPIAANIEDALDIADLNDQARAEVNKIYDQAYRHRVSPKPYLRNIVLTNKSIPKGIIEGYRQAKPTPYDYDRDPKNVASFAPIAREIVGTPPAKPTGLDQMQRVEGCVAETIAHLKRSIEHNRVSDLLYDDSGIPRNEVYSQRLVFAIAEIFAKLYDVDLSQQANAGPGSTDFRFTVGHKARLIVELKLSTHPRIKDGYYEQLPAYAQAEDIKRLTLLIIRVSDANDLRIKSLMDSISAKPLPIDVVVIDAVRKPSASKRPHRDSM